MARPSSVRAAALKNGWRSGLEERNGALLDKWGVFYEFEGERIEYTKPARLCKYTPDFPLITQGSGKKIYVETKGRFMVEDRQKHILIRKQRPDLDIRFVFDNPNARISKTSKTTYAAWCEKNGFLYARKTIPRECIDE